MNLVHFSGPENPVKRQYLLSKEVLTHAASKLWHVELDDFLSINAIICRGLPPAGVE